jgi:hypothetical protein
VIFGSHATQRRSAPSRNDPAELGIALHKPFSLYRILLRQMAEYILPDVDDHFLAMHSMASLARSRLLSEANEGVHCATFSVRPESLRLNVTPAISESETFGGLPHQHLPLK